MADDLPDLCEVMPTCPLCGGTMELVYDQPTTQICVCVDCHTGIHVPTGAWAVIKEKLGETTAPKALTRPDTGPALPR
jgi:hypothetical protein